MMPEQKEEIVISGIGGIFPECDNVDELKELLFNKTNGVTVNSRRWKPDDLGAINGTGKLKHIETFDAKFFSAHPKLTENMDPMTRMFLERSIEAIFDAGLSPSDLSGTNTAVFASSAISETEMYAWDASRNASFSMLGRSRTMQANRVSYILNLSGPSFTTDGGWICGSNGLKNAKQMMEDGHITSAIVGVTNLVIRPELQFQSEGLNRLNRGITTRPFCEYAEGYNRSEACIVMLLQKASEAKRSYGTLLNVKSMKFGDHQESIMEYKSDQFKSLLLDTYKEVNIDPSTVEFIEAYGSGVKREDCMELNVMEEVFCTERRKSPLKVGSIKSNVGHCEVSGLFASMVKAIIALDSGYIPPNINYTKPNDNVAALKNGKIQVITEKTPFDGDIIGVSGFGIMNAFSHVILKRNSKAKKDDGTNKCNLPRLLLASGRTEENAIKAVKKIKKYGNDTEFITLTNDVFSKNINHHFYRCFSILPSLDEKRIDEAWNCDLKKRPVWFIFSGMGSQWHGMGTHLMKLPVFAAAIDKCDAVLKPRGTDIKYILTSQDLDLFENVLNSFVGIAAVQIGLVDVLKALEILPDKIIGHSMGESGCAYADGCFTVEETILSAYARGRASLEAKLIPGMMAAIGLGYDHIKVRLPHDIDVACRNSPTSCTISGPVESINTFVEQLISEGIFAKAVNVSGIAYHGRYIQKAGPTLLKYLKEVIKEPKLRSSKWLSSSLPKQEWNSELAKYSSPEYHTNNLLSSVFFEDLLKHIPSDAITIEIAPHGLLQAIVKSTLPTTVTNIPLTKKMYGDSLRFLLTAVGKLYTNGINPNINALYPKVTFPVSRGTSSIQSLPLWDHSEQWTPIVSAKFLTIPGEKIFQLLLNDSVHLLEYQIYGHHFIPFSYLLVNVWEMFAEINTTSISDKPVMFNDLRFKNNVQIHSTKPSQAYIMIQKASGFFEYILNDIIILSGQICYFDDKVLNSKLEVPKISDRKLDDFHGCISKYELYNILEKNGYQLGDNFKNITYFNIYKKKIEGYVQWTNDWIYFLESLLKFPLFENLSISHVETPVSIRQISINPALIGTERNVCVTYNTVIKEINCNGIKISDVKNGPLAVTKPKTEVVKLEEQTFINFNNLKCKSIDDFLNNVLDIIMEADRLYTDSTPGKLIICTPYHFDDTISNVYTRALKKIIDEQLLNNSLMIDLESVNNISNYDETGRFITVTNFSYLQNTTKAFDNKKCSYIIVYSKEKLSDYKNWSIIVQNQFNDIRYVALMKKSMVIDKNSIFIDSNINSNEITTLETLKQFNSSKRMICIISKSEPIEGFDADVKHFFQKYKSNKLRFVFILDSNAPEFKSNKAFYTNQLSKGLIINIYMNGGWGIYRRTLVHNLEDDINAIDIPVLQNILTHNNLSKHELKVKYLGLNFNDLGFKDEYEYEFGPLEYSGFNKQHMAIMGVTQISSQIHYDPLLSWPVPLSWSLEDAVTVPFSYAMCYYVFKILTSFSKKKSVLVTSGLHLMSQAAISICIVEKYDTYAVVESSQQANQLSNIFPELPRSKIIINIHNKFDITLKMMTKSKGIDLILNFLNGEAFQAAFRTMADHGKFFHFSKSDMKNSVKIGTQIFLRNTTFACLSSNVLLNESDQNKQIIQKALMNGLEEGVVKPFRRCVLQTPLSSSTIFNTMRTSSVSTIPEKVVLALDNDIKNSKSKKSYECNIYQCHSDYVYAIFDTKIDWLDLAEWLVERGALKIVVVMKRCLMSSIDFIRFDRLISKNVSIQIESDIHLNTRDETIIWINRLTSCNVLGSLFIVNQFEDKIIKNLQYAFEKYANKTSSPSFVCISSKGKHICSELKSIGLNAFNISWDGKSPQTNNISKLLFSLDLLLRKGNTLKFATFVCSESASYKPKEALTFNDIANIFPESIEELHLLHEKITKKVAFVEVSTKSPKFSYLKSATPVFVIPGLKPKLIKTLYKKMFYPTFEAQLPEEIKSIDELSEDLVKELRSITDAGYVSLIGECCGGILALKMAQILEAQGTLVTISLIEGDPELLKSLTGCLLSDDGSIDNLNTIYSSFFSKSSRCALEKCDNEFQLLKTTSNQKILEHNIQKTLHWIHSYLQLLSETKPFPNKLHTKVLVSRYERITELNKINLNNYCINAPIVYVLPHKDYNRMMMDKELVNILTEHVTYLRTNGIDLSLSDKYRNNSFYIQKAI